MKFSCLNTLDLTSTGYESEWTEFPKRLTNIFKSIAACNPLKKSIKVVNLAFSGVDKEVKEKMMIELGLESINLKNTN